MIKKKHLPHFMLRMCSYNIGIESVDLQNTLVDEQNNDLLMRNPQSRLTIFKLFPEVNVISSQTRGRGHGHGRGRNFCYHETHFTNHSNSHKRKTSWNH